MKRSVNRFTLLFYTYTMFDMRGTASHFNERNVTIETRVELGWEFCPGSIWGSRRMNEAIFSLNGLHFVLFRALYKDSGTSVIRGIHKQGSPANEYDTRLILFSEESSVVIDVTIPYLWIAFALRDEGILCVCVRLSARRKAPDIILQLILSNGEDCI